jgi:chromosome segregation ATPase
MKSYFSKDVSRLKASLASQKLEQDQEIHQMKVKYQQEETQRKKEFDDRVRHLNVSKDESLTEIAKLNAKLSDLQQKNANQAIEIESLKRNNDSQRSVIKEKDIEIIQNSEQAKSDYDKRIKSIQKEIDRCDQYKDKINELELKIKSKLSSFVNL